jgi:hypothetical protein
MAHASRFLCAVQDGFHHSPRSLSHPESGEDKTWTSPGCFLSFKIFLLVYDSCTVGFLVPFPYMCALYPSLVHPLHYSLSSSSPKVDFRAKKIIRDREGQFPIMIKV